MKKYKLVTVSVSSTGIFIQSTDPLVLDAMLAEVRSIAPASKADGWSQYESPRGTNRCLEIKNLKNTDQGIGWLLMQFLCESGWEPFAVEVATESISTGPNFRTPSTYSFRIET